jgi:hypothetical protein
MRLILLSLLAIPTLGFAQGQLTPPGAPAPTMKTLDQLEPRRVIGTPGATRTTGYTISTSGSYVLAGPIAVDSGNALTISASNVTLDLNGFELSSSADPKAGTAISIAAGRSSIAITNGFITNFAGGIVSDGTTSHSIQVADVTVTSAGVDGIVLARRDSTYNLPALDTSIDRCSAYSTTGHGLSGIGLSANRVALSYADSDGPRAIQAGTVTASRASGATGYTIDAHVADSCHATSNSAIALGAANGCTATNCHTFSYFDYGLDALNATGCYAGSQTSYGARVFFTATGCYAAVESETEGGAFALSATEAIACVADHKGTYGTRWGLYSSGTTSFCYAHVDGVGITGGVTLTAAIAIGCVIDGVSTTNVPAGKKFLGTP